MSTIVPLPSDGLFSYRGLSVVVAVLLQAETGMVRAGALVVLLRLMLLLLLRLCSFCVSLHIGASSYVC